jgi:predicted TIM-barrel fold metal-dependent hydrolase
MTGGAHRGPDGGRPPVIDAHVHLDPVIGGDPPGPGTPWCDRDPAELAAELDAAGVRAVVDLDGGWGEPILRRRLRTFKPVLADRYFCFGGVPWSDWEWAGAAFPERVARRLHAQVADGASGLKISKALGLHVRDDRDRRVPVDDERLAPVWETAAKLGIPVLIHTGDPVAFFEPGQGGEDLPILRAHPEWNLHGRETPGRDVLVAELSRLVGRHPATTFVSAHLANLGDALDRLAALLGQHPNLFVDTGARFDEIGRDPGSARRFFLSHPDRILFGTDFPVSRDTYDVFFRLLETDDKFTLPAALTTTGRKSPARGLDLPVTVLERVYAGNALRLLPGR